MSDDASNTLRAKLRGDPDFRERLKADPRAVLTEIGAGQVPDDVEIVVVENGPKTFHVVLPPADMTLEQMDAFAGGSLFNRAGPRIRRGGWQPPLDWY